MSITKTIYENITKEYDEQRLLSSSRLDSRRSKIEAAVPALKDVEDKISSLYIKRTMGRVSGMKADEDQSLADMIRALKSEKEMLLRNAGFSEKDLEPEYICNECKDTGRLKDGTLCSCFKNKIIEKLYDNSHIRSMLEKENFASFNLNYYSDETPAGKTGKTQRQIATEALEKAKNFVKNFDSTFENLYIYGDTGVGKTFLSNSIAGEIIKNGHTVVYLSAVRLFDILADAAFKRQEDGSFTAKHIYDCDLLIIDDLGTEMTNSFVQTGLFGCINERYLKNKHTIISTNLSVEQLQSVYSERVFSRIMSNYKIIKLFGEDIRIKKVLEG